MEIKAHSGYTPVNPLLNDKKLTPEQRKLAEACTEFEAILVKQMLEAMQGSTQMFGQGFGGKYFQSLFQEELSRTVSVRGIGIAKTLFDQLKGPESSK